MRRVESSIYQLGQKRITGVVVRRFYKWLKGNDQEYPGGLVDKTTLKEKDKLLPSGLPRGRRSSRKHHETPRGQSRVELCRIFSFLLPFGLHLNFPTKAFVHGLAL